MGRCSTRRNYAIWSNALRAVQLVDEESGVFGCTTLHGPGVLKGVLVNRLQDCSKDTQSFFTYWHLSRKQGHFANRYRE